MTKVSNKNASKELVSETAKALEQASGMRRSAENLLKSMRALARQFEDERSELAAQKKREEQAKVISSHSKAFTMLDDDERAQLEAARAEEEAARKAAETQQKTAKPASAAKEEKPAEAVKPAPAAKQEAPAAPVKAAETQQKTAKPAPAAKEEKPAEAAKPAPAAKQEVPAAPKKPAIGQIIARPGEVVVKKPVGLAPNVIRAPRPQTPRPAANPQGPYGRPANPQGPYGRPVNPQGPYGRPVNPQQGGAQNRAPQGQTFSPRPQGSGPANRPQGGFAPRSQGGFGGQRPQGGFGGQRSQGGFGGQRPMGGGRGRAPEITPTEEKTRVSNYDPNKKNYIRQHDPEHVARNRKQAARNTMIGSGYDDDVIRGGRRSRVKKPSVQQSMAPIKIETAYMSGDTITVRDLTERIGKPAGEIIKKLFMLGTMATINDDIDFDTAQLICTDFGITLEKKPEKTAEDQLVEEAEFEDDEENLVERPPVVTIMGHVDHGKTSLLDYIRKTSVTAGEAGGITQHIGAYTVTANGRMITFLDTPGHEAFTAMRARGAQATDIAVLVVAADDSVMPQTVEAINHAKAAGVPIIVAINKMDKPGADAEKVKQDLTNYSLVCEDWGGDTIMVPVSAKTGMGVDDLLEMILLQADVLQLKANPNRLGRGVIIEAKLDKGRGPLATVLLQNGTLHVGDNIIAGLASGRVRALINDKGKKVDFAGPSMPVEIMGFDDVPSAGDEMLAVQDDTLSRRLADERREKIRAQREGAMKVNLEHLFDNVEAGEKTTLNLVIRADVQGSVEAVRQAMEKLSDDKVQVKVLQAAAGAINESDVNMASAFGAVIIGFNIRPDAAVRNAAEKQGVDIRLYTVIYKAIEDMQLAMKGMLKPEYREVLLGHAEVRDVFKITGAGVIAGCYVTDGKVQRNAQVRLIRDSVVCFEGKLSSLKHYKEDVKDMAAGFECGMSLEGHNDIKTGDVVECYIMEEIPR